MFEAKVKKSFSAAHNLRNYKGKCEALHGHNWIVEVTIRAEELDEIGVVKDFVEIKALLMEELDKLDHKYINEVPPFDKINATSELIARHLFEILETKINDGRVRLSRVDVWESENSRASYFRS